MATQGPAPADGALTLIELARLSGSPMQKAAAFSLYNAGSIMADIPLVTRKSRWMSGSTYSGKDGMASVDFRDLNGLPTTTKAVPEPWIEEAYIMSNTIVVDKFAEEDVNNIESPIAFQTRAYLESVKVRTNDLFINNAHVPPVPGTPTATNELKAPVGIKARLLDANNKYRIQPGLNMDAGGVDISPGGINVTNANNLLMQFDRMLSAMNSPNGDGIKIYANEIGLRLFANAVRNLPSGAGYATTQDNFGRMISKFRNAELRDAGRKQDQTTYIVNPYELTTGVDATSGSIPTGNAYGTASSTSANNFTSFYFVRYGAGYLTGWQFEPLNPKNLGLVSPPGTYYQVLFDYMMGWATSSTRSIGRLYDVKVG